jgi:predicted RNase H-like nuclease (RuvC/YqgF family)
MQKGPKSFPFDVQNERDFDDLTQRILDGIEAIRNDQAVPATQEELAKRAVCARKTLHNRGWPIAELKKIKEERKAKKDGKPEKVDAETDIKREGILIEQIRNYQVQNGKLFEQVQDLEDQVKGLSTMTKVLEDEVKSLKEEKRNLESELRRRKERQIGETGVVSISALKEVKKKK